MMRGVTGSVTELMVRALDSRMFGSHDDAGVEATIIEIESHHIKASALLPSPSPSSITPPH
jgi:hypothetical protein